MPLTAAASCVFPIAPTPFLPGGFNGAGFVGGSNA